jgi:hypothetical protein
MTGLGDKGMERETSEFTTLLVGPPGLEPGRRGDNANYFREFRESKTADDKLATNGGA